MSNNITIQETGVAKSLNSISEIQTAEQGGGSITWVPEEERKTMKKTITKKGKYKAKDDHVYAYDEVVVNISGSSDADKSKMKKEPFKAIAPDITIQEGGVGKAMYNVTKLEIKGDNGDTYWIPEDNVKTGTLSVSGNGTFKATDYGVFGWTEVNANKKVKRIYHDDTDGNDYAEYEDGSIEKIPSYIKITTPPSKTEYTAYAPIDTTGMVVTAYYGDGSEYGVVDGWTIDPLVAIPTGGEGDEWTDGQGINAIMCSAVNPVPQGYYRPDLKVFTNTDILCGTPSGSALFTYYNDWLYAIYQYSGEIGYGTEKESVSTHAVAPSTKFKRESFGRSFVGDSSIPTSTVDPTGKDISELHPKEQSVVTVTWEREEDGMPLTDSFNITVNNPPIPPVI